MLARRRNEARINRAYHPPAPAPGPTHGPLITLILPVFDPPPDLLQAAIASVQAQTYQTWQLCIADDASRSPQIAPLLAGLAAADSRITLTTLSENAGITAASNAALACARGAYVAFLDHDDVLPTHAFATLAQAITTHPATSVFFSDEDHLIAGRPANPYFKPGWNPELLLAQNLVCHLAAYRRNLLTQLGGLVAGYDGSQDWHLALRATAIAEPRHVPGILYHWRQRPNSYSATHQASTRQAALRAVQVHLPPGATVTPHPTLPQWNRITYPVPAPQPLVSLILPPNHIAPQDPAYPDTEQCGHPAQATGTILLFLIPNLSAPQAGWLGELVSHALRPNIGAAGPRIDAPGGRIAQSGLILHPTHITQTLTSQADAADPGYRGQFSLARNVAAISPHCLAISRATFERAGGLNPAFGAYATTDLCLRLTAAGLRHIWTPHAHLAYTRIPRDRPDPAAAGLMRSKWSAVLATDPYLHPYLTVRRGQLRQASGSFLKKTTKKLLFPDAADL